MTELSPLYGDGQLRVVSALSPLYGELRVVTADCTEPFGWRATGNDSTESYVRRAKDSESTALSTLCMRELRVVMAQSPLYGR